MRGLWQLVVCTLFVIGCGGASDEPPKPLSKHIDDMHIARIPLDQKGAIVEAQNQWSIAKMENANAEAMVQEADGQVHQAENDYKASKLAVDSAISAKKSAEQSADMNRVNNAQKDLRAAEDSQKAAKERVTYFKVYRDYLKRFARYTAENMYWREAQYENAKGTLAKTNNIQPKGINFEDFPKQMDDRAKRTQKSKERAENEKSKAVTARQNWLSAQSAADKATGRTGNMYDPMAPKEGGPTAVGGGISQEKPQGTVPASGSTPAPAPAPAPQQ
jgi:colicin import membrane protein